MDLDTSRVRELLDKRDEIDAQLSALFVGIAAKKHNRCGHCQEEGHSSRTCPKKPPPAQKQQ